MSNASSNTDDPFSAAPTPTHDVDRDWGGDDIPGGGASWGDRSALALSVARTWVKEHQTATMLGAFAAGVVVGALVRE